VRDLLSRACGLFYVAHSIKQPPRVPDPSPAAGLFIAERAHHAGAPSNVQSIAFTVGARDHQSLSQTRRNSVELRRAMPS